jgi:Tol biopolymer transport system component
MLRGLVFVLAYSFSCQEHVAVENGNVVYTDSGCTAYRLTDSGRDSEPTLSADGREVAFVRAVREVAGIGVPRVVQSEVWTVGTERFSKPKRLYSGPATMPDGRRSNAFWTPKFSPDKRYVYFLSDYSATSAALFRLDSASGAAYFLSPASEYDVLQSGRHRGSIIASIRTVSEPDSEGIAYPIYPYFMLEPNGRKLSRVADENARLEDVVSKFRR